MSDCPYLYDDGAYVLGALSPVERARYERHLATCATCRDAVAEVAALPALLRLVTVGDLRFPAADPAMPEPNVTGQPDKQLAGLVDAAQARRRRDRRIARWRYAAVAVAAAAAALAVGLGLPSAPPERVAQPPSPAPTTASEPPLVAMTPLREAASVQAEIGLRPSAWGTEVIMHCRYPATAGHTKAYAFRLVAYGPDGAADPLGSWTAAPGDDVRLTGFTRFSSNDLARIQLVSSRGVALLDYEVP